jgi:hypothetical protein
MGGQELMLDPNKMNLEEMMISEMVTQRAEDAQRENENISC